MPSSHKVPKRKRSYKPSVLATGINKKDLAKRKVTYGEAAKGIYSSGGTRFVVLLQPTCIARPIRDVDLENLATPNSPLRKFIAGLIKRKKGLRKRQRLEGNFLVTKERPANGKAYWYVLTY